MTRTIVVTGSASGIGLATTEQIEAGGDRVIGVDLADAEVNADLSTPGGRTTAAEGIRAASGGSIDGFVGYAGVGPTTPDIALLTTVNYFGQIALLDAVRPMLVAGNQPAVVIVSSIAPMVSPSDEASAVAMVEGDETLAVELTRAHGSKPVAYSTSKLATLRAGRQRAPEWIDDGVRVNVLAPGNTTTPMTDDALADAELGPIMKSIPVPIGAWAEPAAIADAAVWLLSDGSRYVVGSVLVVDGGVDALVRPGLV